MSNGVDFRKLALDLRAQLTTAQSELTRKDEAYQGAHMMCQDLKSELAALREELAERNAAIELKQRDLIEAQTAVTGWAAKCKAAEKRKSSLHHVGMELMGVIEEYRAMPCDSLMRRMIDTSKRYAPRLLCKCQECYDKGYVMVESGNEANPFTQAPCPACSTKA